MTDPDGASSAPAAANDAPAASGPESTAQPKKKSTLTFVSIIDDKERKFTGPAFARFEPLTKAFYLYVFDGDSQPAPSCTMAHPQSALSKGGYAMAIVEGRPARGASKLPLFDVDYVRGDAAKQTMEMGGGETGGTRVDFVDYDGKTVKATFAVDPTTLRPGFTMAKVPPKGTIDAVVCN